MERHLITITGCVQGVGFRPFIYRLAQRHKLLGSICNTTSGVIIDVQGKADILCDFQQAILAEKPKGSIINEITTQKLLLHPVDSFEIKSSHTQEDTSLALLPDTAICQFCLNELFDPQNRRFEYPFVHCISCGPRFSLFLAMPFDRQNTTMSDFKMCQDCLDEYNNPDNRRFFSQTNCCPSCGPELTLLSKEKSLFGKNQEAINQAIQLIEQGKIVAVKNTGGYQLLVDATNESAVQRLRQLKCRPAKPLALLMPSLRDCYKIAHVCKAAQEAITSTASPIVLVRKQHDSHIIAPSVAMHSPYFGMMLPHTAIQYLLQRSLNRPLVATSGNISGNPLCITEEEAFAFLSPVADVFLIHNRRINHRMDDSIIHIVANEAIMLRRARGYIPYAIEIPNEFLGHDSGSWLATGSHQKSSFAFKKKNKIYISQHIGDLESAQACEAYDNEIEKWQNLLAIKPSEGIIDKHPAYYTSHYAQKKNLSIKAIQHHEAHVWSGKLDCQLEPPFFCLSWDGTGLGDDDTIWGGEGFLITKSKINRISTLLPFRLPGGEKAIKEPRRVGLSLLYTIYGDRLFTSNEEWLKRTFTLTECKNLLHALNKGIQSPFCSSIGRFFDGLSALLDCCLTSQFDGQAAMLLEALAYENADFLPCDKVKITLERNNSIWLMDWRQIIVQILNERKNGGSISSLAYSFHSALAHSIVDLAQIAQQEKVLLTGGVMQNKLLVEMAVEKLKLAGFIPFLHRNVPPNDGGLAVGQIGGKLKEEIYVSCSSR